MSYSESTMTKMEHALRQVGKVAADAATATEQMCSCFRDAEGDEE